MSESQQWETIGNYEVQFEEDHKKIFPKTPDGKSLMVLLERYNLYLRSKITGNILRFQRFLHQRNWYWKDSRRDKSVTRFHVRSELARMLFEGDEDKAQALMNRACCGLDTTVAAKPPAAPRPKTKKKPRKKAKAMTEAQARLAVLQSLFVEAD